MRLVIEKRKILEYLLKPLNKADKSKFLNQLGYYPENWQELQKDIISQFQDIAAEIYEESDYGILYKIEGNLVTPKHEASLTSIWILQNETNYLRLVTLFPKR